MRRRPSHRPPDGLLRVGPEAGGRFRIAMHLFIAARLLVSSVVGLRPSRHEQLESLPHFVPSDNLSSTSSGGDSVALQPPILPLNASGLASIAAKEMPQDDAEVAKREVKPAAKKKAKKRAARKNKAEAERKALAKKSHEASTKKKAPTKKSAGKTKKRASLKKRAEARRKALAKRRAAAKKRALAKKRAAAKKRALAKKQAEARRKALAKKQAEFRRKALAKKQAEARRCHSRPRGWCTHRGSTFRSDLDCDGDGIEDLFCLDKRGATGFRSFKGGKCRDTWPRGQCRDPKAPKLYKLPAFDPVQCTRVQGRNAVKDHAGTAKLWPRFKTARACEASCRMEEDCALFSWHADEQDLGDWRGRCVRWTAEKAKEKQRAMPLQWVRQVHTISGVCKKVFENGRLITLALPGYRSSALLQENQSSSLVEDEEQQGELARGLRPCALTDESVLSCSSANSEAITLRVGDLSGGGGGNGVVLQVQRPGHEQDEKFCGTAPGYKNSVICSRSWTPGDPTLTAWSFKPSPEFERDGTWLLTKKRREDRKQPLDFAWLDDAEVVHLGKRNDQEPTTWARFVIHVEADDDDAADAGKCGAYVDDLDAGSLPTSVAARPPTPRRGRTGPGPAARLPSKLEDEL